MVDAHLPIVDVPVAFNVDPFDPAPPTPVWTNLGSVIKAIGTAQRGRSYELDAGQTGSMDLEVFDRDEKYNPLNTGSALSPNVQPYRKVMAYATWPSTGAGNLFNLLYNLTDGSFESYTNGAAVPWSGQGTFSLTSSVTVTTTNPHAGTKSATFTFNGGGLSPTWTFQIPTVPGSQYTASVWVRQTAANPMVLFINGGASSASNTTINAYFRLSVTFTASAVQHTLCVGCVGSVGVTTVNVDDIQLELGAAATANVTTGGLQRSIWTAGYVERWPTIWQDQGFRGEHSLPCVGPFFALQNQNLYPELRAAIAAKSPSYYWPLTETGTDVQSFADVSGNNGPLMRRRDGKYGAGTFDTGAAMNIPGAPGDGGIHMLQGAGGTRLISNVETGDDGIPLAGPVGTTWGLTLAIVMQRPATMLDYEYLNLRDMGENTSFSFNGGLSNGKLIWGSSTTNFTDFWADNKPHIFILTLDVTPTTETYNVYIDNFQPVTNVAVTTPTSDMSKMKLALGGFFVLGSSPFNGFDQDLTSAHLALWNRTITGPERADLYNAFVGYKGELSGVRLRRWLTAFGLSSFTGDIQDGNSATGPSDAAATTSILDGGQGLAKLEFGNLYESQQGIAFRGRADRYLRTVPAITLGENAAAGEYPYQGDLKFDFDPTYVYNEADISRPGGINAHAEDAASQKRFGRKTFGPETMNYLTDNDAQDAANFVVNYYKIARPRIETVTLDLATGRGTFGDGTMWPGALQLEIGMLARVMRRAKAANGGAGITLQQDYFIENINHNTIDFEAGTWLCTLQLSPALTVRPWILEDATYGLLESTTYLAF